MELEKATLQVISSDEAARPIGDPIPVQFNPTTLRLEISNSTEGGESRGREARQYNGSSSTKLTIDLIFDTADEGTTDAPRSVREKTAAVEQFVYPQGDGDQKQAPPKLRFQWGDLILEGVVESITIDFDHFAANGVPLRAKVGFSFKEQNRRYEFLSSGPGANRGGNTPLAGGLSANASLSLGVVGSAGVNLSLSANASLAIGGESAADFAVRAGMDASSWRGLSLDGGNPLSLEAGAEIGFSGAISSSAGIGFQAGPSAGASVSLEGAFGLQAENGVQTAPAAGGNAGAQQQFTLAAAGGVTAAIESVKNAKVATAEQKTRQAFAAAPSAQQFSVRPAMPDQVRTPLQLGAPASPPAAAPPPPRSDPRATSFGFGLPLRSTISPASEERTSTLSGSPRAGLNQRKGAPTWPVTSDPTTPGWVALPVVQAAATAAGTQAKKTCSCGCSGKAH